MEYRYTNNNHNDGTCTRMGLNNIKTLWYPNHCTCICFDGELCIFKLVDLGVVHSTGEETSSAEDWEMSSPHTS